MKIRPEAIFFSLLGAIALTSSSVLAQYEYHYSYGNSRVVKITPTIWDNVSDSGMASLKKAYDPKLDPFYSVKIEVAPYTNFDLAQIVACKGP